MQRELTPKATAKLLKSAFAAKGASITHTEALDMVAKMKGYEAWSHYQLVLTNQTIPSKPLTILEVLRQHFDANADVSIFPRAEFHMRYKETDNDSYWNAVSWNVMRSEEVRLSDVTVFQPAAPLTVTLPSGKTARWNIEQNLTTRWGELNDAFYHSKPGLAPLSADLDLRNRCTAQMWDEATFVVRKDGKFGVLYEVEYASFESEASMLAESPEDNTYAPHADVVAGLLAAMKELAPRYPNVEFCVPPKEEIAEERPAAWAFVSLDHSLGQEERHRFGLKMLNLLP